MIHRNSILPLRALILCVSMAAIYSMTSICNCVGQEPKAELIMQLKDGEEPQPAEFSELEWLVGRWIGTGLGGDCEEVFLPAWNDSMIGTFRYARDGRLIFSEYFSLVKSQNGGLVLRLKHFHPDFTGWEEKSDFVEFPLIKLDGQTAYFGGITYRRVDDALTVWVAIKDRDGKVREERFEFRQVKSDGPK